MSDRAYIYGEHNGISYQSENATSTGDIPTKTHWDPRIEVTAIAGTVQVGIVPPSDKSTQDNGLWSPDDGQFISLSRSGVNRLMVALREARITVHGTDE